MSLAKNGGLPSQLTQVGPGVSLYNPRGLRRWRAALGDAIIGRAPIICIGDSITYGVGGDGVNATNATIDPVQGWAGQLRSLFKFTYGDPAEGFIPTDDARYMVNSGGTVYTSTGPLHQALKLVSTNTLTITVPAGLNSVGIIQWENLGNVTATYTLDGGASTSLGALSGTDTYTEHSIAVTPGATHTIVVSGPATAQTYIAGAVFRNQTTGVPVHRMGRTGYVAADPIGGLTAGVLALSAAQQDRVLRSHFQWENSNPGLIIMSFLANDMQNQKVTYTLTDGATTNGSTIVTSASATFDISDVGKAISGAGIPGGTYIGSVQSSTQCAMTANATATATGVSITVTATPSASGITAALYQTYLTQFITTAVSNGWCVLLLGEPQASFMASTGPAPPSTEAAYRAALKTIAETTDHVAYLDVKDLWGTQPTSQANGLQLTSSVHPTRKGHGDLARLIHIALNAPLGENAPTI